MSEKTIVKEIIKLAREIESGKSLGEPKTINKRGKEVLKTGFNWTLMLYEEFVNALSMFNEELISGIGVNRQRFFNKLYTSGNSLNKHLENMTDSLDMLKSDILKVIKEAEKRIK